LGWLFGTVVVARVRRGKDEKEELAPIPRAGNVRILKHSNEIVAIGAREGMAGWKGRFGSLKRIVVLRALTRCYRHHRKLDR
jgi:hypothetical protein